ncbi:hypothetical protein J6590_033726 [Homalodisca vitripennis]|nr:hypothetical protein J6590_033726 [Homalodisca vitripennis]
MGGVVVPDNAVIIASLSTGKDKTAEPVRWSGQIRRFGRPGRCGAAYPQATIISDKNCGVGYELSFNHKSCEMYYRERMFPSSSGARPR